MPKSIYFASDFHLGLDQTDSSSKEREKRIIRWLDDIKDDAKELFLLGDVFDYWFEYKKVVPKGFVRLLGKLAEFSAAGIPLHIFTGNHDMWLFDYLEKEIGATVYKDPIKRTFGGKIFFLGHGDGLGPGDHGYKFIKKVFRFPINQWLFARLHPNLGIALMQYFSRKSRESDSESKKFLGPEKEWLVQFCEGKLKEEHMDYFIFGHRHLAIDHTLSNGTSRYINAGDWLTFNSYVVFDGEELSLKYFQK